MESMTKSKSKNKNKKKKKPKPIPQPQENSFPTDSEYSSYIEEEDLDFETPSGYKSPPVDDLMKKMTQNSSDP